MYLFNFKKKFKFILFNTHEFVFTYFTFRLISKSNFSCVFDTLHSFAVDYFHYGIS